MDSRKVHTVRICLTDVIFRAIKRQTTNTTE